MKGNYFRVYPEERSLYFLVFIWDSKKSMYQAIPDVRPRNFTAVVRGLIVYRGQRKMPCIGEIHFVKRWLGTGLVTHEFFHASLVWARRVKLDFPAISLDGVGVNTHPDEERLCYAHGSMVRQFIDRAYKLGYYP